MRGRSGRGEAIPLGLKAVMSHVQGSFATLGFEF